ncbi:hypothetical protein V1511DRAFT_488931 [Dipodascopsis uninucleata]
MASSSSTSYGRQLSSKEGETESSQAASRAGSGTSSTSSTRQRSAIACRYCRRRKIRCSGYESNPNDVRCTNCIKFNQQCIFTPVSAIVGTPSGEYSSSLGRQPIRSDQPLYQSAQQPASQHLSLQQPSSQIPITPPYTSPLGQQSHYGYATRPPPPPLHNTTGSPSLSMRSMYPSSQHLQSSSSQYGQSYSYQSTQPPNVSHHLSSSFQSSTGSSILPPVNVSSKMSQRSYSITDPTNYRYSTVHRTSQSGSSPSNTRTDSSYSSYDSRALPGRRDDHYSSDKSNR